jgi:DNA/RNA endonuclease G (NUC1)
VPAKLWKVVLVLPREDAEPRKNSRIIAVIMPNDHTVGFNWAKYHVTTREVERLTGLWFFSEALRDHFDEVYVPVPKSRKRSKKGESP